ncbi:MAG: DNA polymerase IV [Endozoicomonas sp. (ex Botrylloides leachii)]|nr:DNA polymerase IV [Endozoicomonas sp. (ex Botrylloides leachii)]
MTEKKSERKIIHVDFDAFFSAIEIRDNPDFQGRPIAVGGAVERRGVIATCSYEARRFGVRSAMASGYAKRLCPELLIIPPRFSVYKSVSAQAHDIFDEYSDQVEPLSLDEAYLDVSEATHCHGSATLIAKEMRSRISKEIGLTVSAGVAPNKFLAKIASDWYKPNGLCVVGPDQVDDFVFRLPVTNIFGVGKVTANKLHRKGIKTCGDLRQYSLIELHRWLGSFGEKLWELCRGIDERPVQSHRIRKSLSVERTYPDDLPDLKTVLGQLNDLYEELHMRYQRLASQYIVTKRFVKIKFDDFTQTTLEESIGSGNSKPVEHFNILLNRAWDRGQRSVRLLGLGFRLNGRYDDASLLQMTLFD